MLPVIHTGGGSVVVCVGEFSISITLPIKYTLTPRKPIILSFQYDSSRKSASTLLYKEGLLSKYRDIGSIFFWTLFQALLLITLWITPGFLSFGDNFGEN